MLKEIAYELKEHAPFTVCGAVSAIVLIPIFANLPFRLAHNIFYVLHPMHIVLSALATTSMYEFHKCRVDRRRCSIWMLLLVGYLGSIGVATLSDSLIPYWAETLLRMPNRQTHLGFIEKWWLINPLAVLGIAIAYFRPHSKFPHAGHVLLSTWASLFHIIMAGNGRLGLLAYLVLFCFLFLAVWVPCCVSDIVFPLLFVRSPKEVENKR